MQKVLVSSLSIKKSAPAKAKLESAGVEVVYAQHDGRGLREAELVKAIPGCTALIAGMDDVTEKAIKAGSPTLKLVARIGVGYNNVDLGAAERYGVKVTITPDANMYSVADLALGLLLSVARSIPTHDQITRAGEWRRINGSELHDKTLGIIGLGKIGLEVAKRAKGFGMQIIAYDLFKNPAAAEKYDISYTSLEELLNQADFVTLHAPEVEATKGIINRQTLSLMKPSAYLINTARGPLVNESDLYDALKERKIAGAGLDAFAQEPPADKRFFQLDNVVLTPHAGASTVEANDRMSLMAVDEVLRVISGRPPVNTISAAK